MGLKAEISEFIPEKQVSEHWPILPATDLKRARRKREIAFYQSPVGPHYKAADVEEFIERKYRQCPQGAIASPAAAMPMPVGRMAPSILTSRTQSAEAHGTPASMTDEHERLLVEAFGQRISKRQSGRSSPSSPPRQSPAKTPLTHETSRQ